MSADRPLTAHVVALATIRAEVEARAARVKEARDGFELVIALDVKALNAAKAELAEAEATVRALALVAHEMTKDKKPAPGVSIIDETTYTIDPVKGFAWAKEKGMCMIPESLDVKAVEKLATVQKLDFVTITKAPAVRIAKDLTTALQEVVNATA